MLCYRCGGSGKYLGNGMMMTNCTLCDEDGKVIEKPKCDSQALAHVDRKSKSYQKAIKDIMELNPKLTRVEAVKMFDKAYTEV